MSITHERRRPEHATLYQVVQEGRETFLVEVEAHTGSGLLLKQAGLHRSVLDRGSYRKLLFRPCEPSA